jgi:glutamyl/glutaminyl-tRNA synthetase
MPVPAAGCRAIRPRPDRRRRASRDPLSRPEERDVVFTDAVRGDVRFQTDVIGDPVIVRADGSPAYNFAVVVDDALMEVTHVVRGEDHISNTPRQILLYEALGFTPPTFAHLSLVMGPDHSPLSKRHGATSVAEFRSKGYLPEALVNYLALIGWSPGGGDELLPIDELARRSRSRASATAPECSTKRSWPGRTGTTSRSPIRRGSPSCRCRTSRRRASA